MWPRSAGSCGVDARPDPKVVRWVLISSCATARTLRGSDLSRPTGGGAFIFSGDALLQDPGGCGHCPGHYDTVNLTSVAVLRGADFGPTMDLDGRLGSRPDASYPENRFFRQLTEAGGRLPPHS